MAQGLIYRAVSPNGKKYYGFTSALLEWRKYYHRKFFNRGKKTRFYSAIKKHGWENFQWETIEIHSRENKKELRKILCEREIFWIEKDKTFLKEHGYNMTKGGDGRFGDTHSPEVRKILSEKLTGRTTERKGKSFETEMIEKYGKIEGIKKYEQWIDRMRKAKIGKKLSEEHKKNLSKNHRRKQTEETKNKIKEAWKNGAFANRKRKKK